MALYGSFAKHRHLDELAENLQTAGGNLTPAQRRQLMLNNLFGSTGLVIPNAPSLVVDSGVGTVTTSSTTVATESGSDDFHNTKLVMTNFSLGDIADNASLAIGAKFYTFPAGDIFVNDMVIAGVFSAAVDDTSQTPEYGVGSTIGTGAVATLSTTMEDYIDGGAAGGMIGGTAVIPDLLGTTVVAKGMLETIHGGNWIKASGGLSHDLFLNAADAWDDVTAVAPLLFTGTITFRWRKIT